ncbi:MAG TPA: hypothetical protein PLL36_13620 [Candidatus Hydrogenedentes bacterium]|nr:hypothetical protein [Candidatus Hydrogenedentota bacterium]HOC70286.1 hypothetical protein [Candidatus Hydrogenedentota bacterium]HQN02113.1 hypothetical protein [Candidatus Hydrogenedentota bacterium]
MIFAPNMLLIGAAGRNAGKTTFACEIIRRFRNAPVNAAKVTAIEARDGLCPRGGEGCGVCTSLEGDFCITEETDPEGKKDTRRLLAAGAQRVLWLRVLKSKLEEEAGAFVNAFCPDTPLVCESNSLRNAVVPGLFLMIKHSASREIKQSAQGVLSLADAVIYSDGTQFQFDFERISLAATGWRLDGKVPEHAARENHP